MKTKDIKFLEIRYLRGPNIWTYRPVIEAVVDIGELEDFPSNTIPGFYERLTALLPSLIEHRCSYGERGGFLRRVQEGTWPAHILEHVTLELQNLAGMPGGFGKARETSTRGVYKVVVRAWHEDVTRACLYAGRDLLLAAIQDTPFDVAGTSRTWPTWPSASCSGRAPVASSKRRPPRTGAFRRSVCWPPAISCNSATAPAADASGPPKPTAPAHCRRHLARQGSDQDPAQILRRAGPRRAPGR
jgi:hypothetical protein